MSTCSSLCLLLSPTQIVSIAKLKQVRAKTIDDEGAHVCQCPHSDCLRSDGTLHDKKQRVVGKFVYFSGSWKAGPVEGTVSSMFTYIEPKAFCD